MNIKTKTIITFILSFIITFFIVGYVKYGMLVAIDWVEGVTIWNKLNWYYGYNFISNFISSLFLAIIITLIHYLIIRKKALSKVKPVLVVLGIMIAGFLVCWGLLTIKVTLFNA